MSDHAVASAVVIPEPMPSPPQGQASTKRSAPETNTDETSPKRQRHSPSPARANANATPAAASTTSDPLTNGPPRERDDRDSSKVDERKRSKRLFGSLLGTLSQTQPTTAATKRRAEIEERKRQEARQRETELAEKQHARLAALAVARKRQQRRVDEVDMRVRHGHKLAMARFLVTKEDEGRPRLYYRPWELRPEEEARIARQLELAEAEVEREREAFRERQRRWREEDDDEVDADGDADREGSTNGHGADEVQHPQDRTGRGSVDARLEAQEAAVNEKEIFAASMETDRSAALERPPAAERDGEEETPQQQAEPGITGSVDDSGDVMVDAGEDAILY